MLLRKKMLVYVAIALILSSIVAAEICNVEDIKTSLKKALYDYLTKRTDSKFNRDEVRNLLVFYLSIGPGILTADCSEDISSTIAKAGPISLLNCTDGTLSGQCSSQRPKYCNAGILTDKCKTCGCPSRNMSCQDNSCIIMGYEIACNIDADCGINGFTGPSFCYNNDVYRNYTMFKCNNNSLVYSFCTSNGIPSLAQDCNASCGNGICTAGEIPVGNCQTLNQPNAYYKLNQSITTTGTCFTINANGITLDLNGHSLTGDEGSTDYGVSVNSYNRTTIKNGEIYRFGIGIKLFGSSGNTLSDITSNLNKYSGIHIIFVSSDNKLEHITANSNYYGIRLDASSRRNNLTDITANLNSQYGIYLQFSSANTITDSSFCGNTVGDCFESIPPNTGTGNYFDTSGRGCSGIAHSACP